jgi:tellurite resistance protein TerC
VIASVVFCAFVWKQRGEHDGIAWATGYALEWALSMDNLFVFHLVFKAFSVPNDQAMKALRIGIYGAVFFRVIFIAFLSHLLSLSYAVDVILGLVLIYSGVASLSDDDEEDVEDMSTVRFCKWLFGKRLLSKYAKDGSLITTSKDGSLQMTLLFLVVCVISVIDCVFAVDSVGAKTGQIKNIYINLTSSLMGMFSLRSLFFIIRDMAEYFDYVKYGICSILCFVGVDMIVSKWYPVSLTWMCAIISILFVSSVVASVLKIMIYGSDEDDSDDEKKDDSDTKDDA